MTNQELIDFIKLYIKWCKEFDKNFNEEINKII